MLDTQEPQEVYIGNGVTKHVIMDEKNHHYLDIEKLEKIINDNPDKKIKVGAKEDWFFTAQTVTKDDLEKYKEGGSGILSHSAWDVIIIKIEDENSELIDEVECTINIEKYPSQLAFAAGYQYAMQRTNSWFDKSLLVDCLLKWKYEIAKDFTKEVNALIAKYEKIHQNLIKSSDKEEPKCWF